MVGLTLGLDGEGGRRGGDRARAREADDGLT